MKKTTTIITALALALSLGMSFSPLVLASEDDIASGNNIPSELIKTDLVRANEVHPLLQFTRLDADGGYLSFIFNPEDNKDYALRHLMVGTYNYIKYTQSEVEQNIELLKLPEMPSWASTWLNNNTFYDAPGIHQENNLPMLYFPAPSTRFNILANMQGTIYYALEYENKGESEWIIGELDFKECAHFRDAYGYIESTPCLMSVSEDGSTWEYTRENPEITTTLTPWKEQLADYLLEWLSGIEEEFGWNTPEDIESKQQRLYQELLTTRKLATDTTPELYNKIMLHSRDTYKVIFGEYEEGYDPDEPEEKPTIPLTPLVPGTPINPPVNPDPTNPTNPTDPTDPDPENPDPVSPNPTNPDITDPEKPITPVNPGKPVAPTASVTPSDATSDSSEDTQVANTDNSQPSVVVAVNNSNQGNATPVTSDNNAETNSQPRGEEVAEAGNSDTLGVQVPVLSENQTIPVAKKSWNWPFWIIIATGAGLLGWLAVRIYKRRH